MSTGLHSLCPRLLADIGGTFVRFALETAPGVLEKVDVQPCSAFPSLQEAVNDYVSRAGRPVIMHAAFGIATPVTSDRVCMTNQQWQFSIEDLRRALGLQTLIVINDFSALAMSLPHLPSQQLRQVGGAAVVADAPVGLIGPGTGLGVSGLIPGAGAPVPLAGEGGHRAFSPCDQEEDAILAFARKRFGRVSCERLISGAGIELIHQARLSIAGHAPGAMSVVDIIGQALNGQSEDCRATLDRFCAMLGSAAADLALTLGARGGIYIGGGIVPRFGELFVQSPFRARFEEAGRLSAYLAQIPVFVINSPYPGLIGASAALASSLRELNHA
jgi:glucokinase